MSDSDADSGDDEKKRQALIKRRADRAKRAAEEKDADDEGEKNAEEERKDDGKGTTQISTEAKAKTGQKSAAGKEAAEAEEDYTSSYDSVFADAHQHTKEGDKGWEEIYDATDPEQRMKKSALERTMAGGIKPKE